MNLVARLIRCFDYPGNIEHARDPAFPEICIQCHAIVCVNEPDIAEFLKAIEYYIGSITAMRKRYPVGGTTASADEPEYEDKDQRKENAENNGRRTSQNSLQACPGNGK